MLRQLLLALAFVFAALSDVSVAAPLRIQPFPTAEMMRATGLDEVFTQFGPAIAASAREQQITADEIFLRRWEATALEVFDAGVLRQRLADALDGKFSDREQEFLGAFFHSVFGERITALEREAALLDPEGQERAVAEGQALADAAGPVRAAQLDKLMQLVSTEISATMVGQSVRAMLMGMAVSHQRGTIDVPWADIDAQVKAMMPDLQARVAASQRAMMAYAYRNLDDADLDRYIAFLETPTARKFYGVAALAVGRIVTQEMSAFGTALAQRMASVEI